MNNHIVKSGATFMCIVFVVFTGCVAIVEPNISSEEVILMAPADGLKTYYSTQTFWWNEVVNANSYQLQVVTPSFDYVERLILDTIITSNKFSTSLYPAQFQWRVRAANYSYITDFSTWSFEIDSTFNLSNQAVVLINPSNNDTTNKAGFLFEWDKMYNASMYIFQLDKYGVQIRHDTTTENQILVENFEDASYSWRVKAINDISETNFFSRSFFIYTVIPSPPVLKLPQNNEEYTSSDIIQFSWERDQESIPSITDNLFIANDSLFDQVIIDKECPNPNYENIFDTGIYFWKVNSVDKAGNVSDFSSYRRFIVYNSKK